MLLFVVFHTVNMTNTGKLLGMCPTFIGMHVRLCTKVSSKFQIVHHAPGTVLSHQFDSRADLSWQLAGFDASQRGCRFLKYLPLAVFVRFDKTEQDFGFGPGVIALPPASSTWSFKTHDRWSGLRKQVEVSMSRTQVPLCPERIRTVQTAQGMSMDACKMYLGQPGNMVGSPDKEDDYWTHLIVMLSRVRSARNILLYELPDSKFFGRGSPLWMKGDKEMHPTPVKSHEELAATRKMFGGASSSR